jgi:hypothetical protein
MLHDDDGNGRVRQDTVQLAPIPVQSRPDLGHHLGNGEPQPACSLNDTGDLPVKIRLLVAGRNTAERRRTGESAQPGGDGRCRRGRHGLPLW